MKETQTLLYQLREIEQLRENWQKWWKENQFNSVLLIDKANLQEKFDRALACTALPAAVRLELIAERDRLMKIANPLGEARDLWTERAP